MKFQRILAIILCFVLVLASCNKSDNITQKDSKDSLVTSDNNVISNTGNTVDSDDSKSGNTNNSEVDKFENNENISSFDVTLSPDKKDNAEKSENIINNDNQMTDNGSNKADDGSDKADDGSDKADDGSDKADDSFDKADDSFDRTDDGSNKTDDSYKTDNEPEKLNDNSEDETNLMQDLLNSENNDIVFVTMARANNTIVGKEATELVDIFKHLELSESFDMLIMQDAVDWDATVMSDEGHQRFSRINTNEGWKLMEYYSKNFYNDSDELTDKILKYVISDNYLNSSSGNIGYSDISGDSDIIGFSIDCSEPSTEEEYLSAGISLLKAWLTEVQSEDTDEYYKNTGFVINDEGKSNYLSCGIVNGKKEFAVELCFTVQDTGDGTFYDKYYQEGRYTERGTFWSGNYICARFRYENGKCTLIKIGDRSVSSTVQQGLNGIITSGYKNFFEFARRADMDEAIDKYYVPYGPAVNIISRSLTQTADGVPVEFCIYPSGSSFKEDEDSVTAIFHFCTTMNGEAAYSTGVYFTDNSTGHMEDTLPKNFRLTFDNYDGDANPDYCIRYMNDEDGTYYCLERLISDGRVLNLSGRAFEGGIYIAGCFEASPRLQRTENIPYIGWKIEDGKYYPTDNNGYRINLEDLNMYADRLYLPKGLNAYSTDEDKITCFLWNNTEKEIKTDGTYSIEILEGKIWNTVAEGLKISQNTVAPRSYAEISYDISGIKDRKHAKYRIVQGSGNLTAYGEFICEGEEVETFSGEASDIVSGMHFTDITISHSDFFDTSLESAAIIIDGKKLPLSIIGENGNRYIVSSSKMPENPGEYDILLNDTVYTKLSVKDAAPKYNIEVKTEKRSENVIVTLTSETDLKFSNLICFKKNDKGYEEILLVADTDDKDYSAAKDKVIHKSEPYTIKMCDYMKDYLDEETLKQSYDEMKETDFRYGIAEGLTKDTTYDEFKKFIIDKYFYNPDSEYYAAIYLIDGEEDVVVFHRF